MSLIACGTLLFAPNLNSALEASLEVSSVQALVLNLGSALIGATAIVTSLVLFSMQVNVERMPHGLFRRLGSDSKLLGAFALAFMLALTIAVLSVAVSKTSLGYIIIIVFWSVASTLGLFLYAYRRALILVNPTRQIEILLRDTAKHFQGWSNRADRISPLVIIEEQSDSISSHDTRRVLFFRTNANWAAVGMQSLQHAISYAQRYSSKGDYEVASAALAAVLNINHFYIAAKGKTFFAESGFIESPLSSDNFITNTLEQLRQHADTGIARRDEQQIIQTMRTFRALVGLYGTIDYSSEYATKSHAYLAGGYLSSLIKGLVRRDLPDVLMEGQRELGTAAKETLHAGAPDDLPALCIAIADVALSAILTEKNRPATQVGIGQLADITFHLIISGKRDIGYAARTIRDQLHTICRTTLLLKSDLLSRIHSSVLGDYYSATSLNSLGQRLSELVGAIIAQPEDSKEARSVIRNFEAWIDGSYKSESELLHLALGAKSPFVHDILTWISTLATLAIGIADAPACEPYSREKLIKHADRLVCSFNYLPDAPEQLEMADNYHIVDIVFRMGISAYQNGCHDVMESVVDTLVDISFKIGKYEQLAHVLHHGLTMAAVLITSVGGNLNDCFKNFILYRLRRQPTASQEILARASRELRVVAQKLHVGAKVPSRFGDVLYDVDKEILESLLYEIAAVME